MPRTRKNNIDHKKALAFEEFIRNADDVVLECRVGRHRMPDWLSKLCEVSVDRRTGHTRIEGDCERGCGTRVIMVLGADGILAGSGSRYDYSDTKGRYLLPREARTGHSLSKAQRGSMRLELIARRDDK